MIFTDINEGVYMSRAKELLKLIESVNTASLSKCLAVINKLVKEDLIHKYAISGGYVNNSIDIKYGNTTTKIIKLEYLMAIMIDLNRSKDRNKLEEIINNKVEFDSNLFTSILNKYKLTNKWSKIESEFSK